MASIYWSKPLPLLQKVGTAKTRKCLKCLKQFVSTGLRICPECTEGNKRVGKRVEKGSKHSKVKGHVHD